MGTEEKRFDDTGKYHNDTMLNKRVIPSGARDLTREGGDTQAALR
ncbi:MAG: hypothetical protein QOE73_1487, partial [Verrucomicrobiota bacterium]